jgi:SWIM zinc finger
LSAGLLERRFGLDPRIDRAYRIVVSDRVDLSVVDSKAGLVHGDSGRSYWATVDGFCECPDAERVARCKHALAVTIAVQLRAVAKAKAARQAELREVFAVLAKEHQDHGRELIHAGIRPIDDPAYRDRDEQLQAMRRQLPPLVIR